jgi:hypothetical protein
MGRAVETAFGRTAEKIRKLTFAMARWFAD